MKSLAGSIALGGALAFVVGCSAKPLQPDAGSTGGGTIGVDGGTSGAGGATGTGGAGAATGAGGVGTGGAGGALFAGRRSFVVTSTLSLADTNVPTGAPTSHVFTMIVDGDSGSAVLGAKGNGFVSPIEPAPGGFRVTAPMPFGVPGASPWFVYYTDLAFTLDPAGLLSGSGSGRLILNGGGGCNMNYTGDATMSLTGTLDTVAPVLAIAAAGDLTDPFSSFGVFSSEPLPGQTAHPVLRSASGDTVVFAPSFTTSDSFITAFVKPTVVLRFGEQYSIDLTGMTDFAGNAAVAPDVGGLGFVTAAVPPLIPADGFESASGATLGGGEVLSGPGDPIISGTRSLYIPPGDSPANGTTKTQLALRLSAAPGKTFLRFSYRTVDAVDAGNAYFAVGSVGGSMTTIVLPADGSGSTTATIRGAQVSLGPVATWALELPTDATGEIVFERIAQPTICPGFPAPPTAGIIIDDLRVE